MSDLIVYGFPRSTFVNIVRLVLTYKEVPYTFHDLEPEMGKPSHLALHPFNRVPILQHGDFTVYETSAIVSYLEETFPKPALQPKSARDRARMNQWISAVNSYWAVRWPCAASSADIFRSDTPWPRSSFASATVSGLISASSSGPRISRFRPSCGPSPP